MSGRSNVWSAIRALLLGLVVMLAVTMPWGLAVRLNVRSTPGIPWAIPLIAPYLAVVLLFLNGRGWPTSSSATRRRKFRLRLLSPSQWRWSLLSGCAGVLSLWLAFAAVGGLNHTPEARAERTVPRSALLAFVLAGAAVTAFGEEAAFRGFMQASLERHVGPVTAVATTSIAFALIHANHGFDVLLRNGPFYLAVGCLYGALAYLTQSILPSLVLHFVGDVVVFGLSSSLFLLSGPHTFLGTTTCIIGGLTLAATSILSCRRLAACRTPLLVPCGTPTAAGEASHVAKSKDDST